MTFFRSRVLLHDVVTSLHLRIGGQRRMCPHVRVCLEMLLKLYNTLYSLEFQFIRTSG